MLDDKVLARIGLLLTMLQREWGAIMTARWVATGAHKVASERPLRRTVSAPTATPVVAGAPPRPASGAMSCCLPSRAGRTVFDVAMLQHPNQPPSGRSHRLAGGH